MDSGKLYILNFDLRTCSSGLAAPLVGAALTGTGISGSSSAIIATAQDRFAIIDWSKDFAIEAGTSIVTCGAGYGAGALMVALTTTTKLSNAAITVRFGL